MDSETLQDLYAWIDKIPLSKPKRNITRDFSDGVMAAEVVKHFFPKLIELHNYSPASSTQQKLSNWSMLNRKVFSKLNFHVTEETMKKIVVSTPAVIESVLCTLREKIDSRLECTADHLLDVEYYNTRNQETLPTETRLIDARIQPQSKPGGGKQKEQSGEKISSQPEVYFTSDLEKEQALMTLKETVEILQMKVNRLERLLHLKDLRIEDLTKHLEAYKTRTNVS